MSSGVVRQEVKEKRVKSLDEDYWKRFAQDIKAVKTYKLEDSLSTFKERAMNLMHVMQKHVGPEAIANASSASGQAGPAGEMIVSFNDTRRTVIMLEQELKRREDEEDAAMCS